MNIGFFSEAGYEGKVSRDNPNMRTDVAWVCALGATHHRDIRNAGQSQAGCNHVGIPFVTQCWQQHLHLIKRDDLGAHFRHQLRAIYGVHFPVQRSAELPGEHRIFRYQWFEQLGGDQYRTRQAG